MGALLGAMAKPTSTPVPFARDGIYNGRTFGVGTRDRETQMRTIEHNGTLWQIVHRTSTSLASVQWHLYRATPDRNVTTDRVEVFRHAALDLLRKPNKFMSGYRLRETVQQHVDLTGEGYIIVAKYGRLPLELWPVMPNRMEPVPSSTKFLAGWMYTGPNGEQIPLECDEVLQIKMPHPRDPYRGLGPVQSILTQLDAAKYSVEWNRNFFLNSATPNGVIQLDRRLNDDDWDELVLRWNEQHKGVSRAHRVAVIEEGTWQSNTMSMVDMQFSELQTQSRDRLLEAFGIAGSMIGVVEDVNRANAEAGKAMFAEYLTVPRADRWRDDVWAPLLAMYGSPGATPGVEMDYDSPVPTDVVLENATRTSKAQAALNLVNAGYDPDDVLDAVELPKMKYAGKPTAPVPPGFGTPPDDPNADPNNPDGPDEPDEPVPPKPGNLRAIRRPHIHNDSNDIDTTDIDLTTVDEQWQAAVSQVVGEYTADVIPIQRQELLNQIVAHVDAGKLRKLAALSASSADGAARLLSAMHTFAAQAAHQVTVEAMQQGVDGIEPVVPKQSTLADFADVTAALMAGELSVSAGREAMRVYADGMSGVEVADAVGDFLRGLSDAGPTMHLGAAMSVAQNRARVATFTAASNNDGPIASLYAVEVLDRNTCPPCREIDGRFIGNSADGETTSEVDGLYPNGGYVNCAGKSRCRGTITGVWRSASTGSTEDGAEDGGGE